MNFSNESLLVILIGGVAAGWLAGQIVQGTGFGLLSDLVEFGGCANERAPLAVGVRPPGTEDPPGALARRASATQLLRLAPYTHRRV